MTGAIIYYTSNQEEIEDKVIADMMEKKGDLPVISVSQKPMDLGKNICVGDVGISGFNVCRQIQIACQNTDADYVIAVESDCLYSPDYFRFIPPRLDTCYRNSNIYVLGYKKDYFSKKSSSIFAQIIGREFYLKYLEELFAGLPMWNKKMKNFPKEIGRKFFDTFETFETKYPCISLKTGKGMRKHSASGRTKHYELPHWGTAKDVYEIL